MGGVMSHRSVFGVTAGVLLAAAFVVFLPRPAPAASVTIREPAFGLPHFYGDTDLELAYENGREIAKDRLGQLILLGRAGRGTLYQAFGPLDPSTLQDDIEARRTAYTSSELNAMFAKYPKKEQDYLFAYCDGVNDTIEDVYAGRLPQPIEVALLRQTLGLGNDLFGNATNVSDQVDPNYRAPGGEDPARPNAGYQYTPEIAMAIAVLEIRIFAIEKFDEQERLAELQALIAKHGQDAGTQIWDDLNFLNDPLSPVTVPDPTTPGFGGPLAGSLRAERATRMASHFPAYDYASGVWEQRAAEERRAEFARRLGAWPALGSFAWLISGERSATGYPWVGGFPQTGIQTPSIMHFAENRSAEGVSNRINARGMEFAGAPLILIGHTDTVAWTVTTAHLRVADTFFEQIINEETDSLRYNDEGTPAPLKRRTEIFLGGLAPSTSRVFWRSHERGGNGGSRPVTDFIGDVEGTASGGTATRLNAANAFDDGFAGGHVAIVEGTGAGQIRRIQSVPSAGAIEVASAWTTVPNATSVFVAVKPGNTIVASVEDSMGWLEEGLSVLAWTQQQRAESVLDVRAAARRMPTTNNFLAADNLPFNGIGTQNGNGNIGYYSTGFSRQRPDGFDPRLPLDGSIPNPLVVASGTVKKATASGLDADGSPFAGQNFAPPALNFRYENPTEKGDEYVVAITSGTGHKQTHRIASNTASSLQLESPWGQLPGKGATFEVYRIVAMPEAINPSEGFMANWNNKAATADDGINSGRFGRQYEHVFILEQLAEHAAWDRDDSRQLNKDVAGLERSIGGDAGRYLIPRLRQAVTTAGSGGNANLAAILTKLEAFQAGSFLGRSFIDPVTSTTYSGAVTFLINLIDRLAQDIYGDEYGGAVVSPTRSKALNLVLHAIDSAAGDVPGSYTQAYTGDYFGGQPWETVVRNSFSSLVTSANLPADSARPVSRYRHPLAALFPVLEFESTPFGQRGTYEQIVDVGPTVTGEFIYPLGQSGLIEGSILGVTNIDPNVDSLQPIWRDWRFVPMVGAFSPSSPSFLCYKAKGSKGAPKFAALPDVPLADEFGEAGFSVSKQRAVCMPQNGPSEGDSEGFVSHQIKLASGGQSPVGGVETQSPYGPVTLDTGLPDRLLVASAIGLDGAPDGGPNGAAEFKCYKAAISKGSAGLPKGLQFDFSDAFESRRYDVKKVTRLCNPVDGTADPDVRMICYQIKAAKGEPKHRKVEGRIHASNDLGDDQRLDTVKEEEACVPVSAAEVEGDTDGDGILDGFERWYYGNLDEDADSDTDNDGLTLLGEFEAGTDPTNPDTDGDGVADGADDFPQDRLRQ
jgi:hypothetical protein